MVSAHWSVKHFYLHSIKAEYANMCGGNKLLDFTDPFPLLLPSDAASLLETVNTLKWHYKAVLPRRTLQQRLTH